MATEDIACKISNVSLKDQEVNILLVGETGVGKSTFINSLANYLLFKSYKKALKGDLQILIPTQFSVTDKNYERVVISSGTSDKNENQEIGAAATQDVKTYVFPIGEGKTKLRLIDTPGMGDPKGIEQDNINCEYILSYLTNIEALHGICLLLKPNQARLTVLFEHCVKQILSRLEKSAANNIIFIFTNSRGTMYTPGDTLECLKKIIVDIKCKPPHVNIPIKDNVFCFDNEAFRYLMATKKGVQFPQDVEERFVESWNHASAECMKLIHYIMGDGASKDSLPPHHLVNTRSINEARRLIEQLAQPLADISQLIFENIRILKRHENKMQFDSETLEEMKMSLYIPILDLKVIKLPQPVTVCTSTKCTDIIMVGDLAKRHYRQRCHDPCYLSNIPKEIVGDPGLMRCTSMDGKICTKCACNYAVHQHIYYMTETFESRRENSIIKNNITTKEEAVLQAQKMIKDINMRKDKLDREREIIVKSTAQFAHFLQNNAITPFNDSYRTYIEYLIKREESLGRSCDLTVVAYLKQLLIRYDEIKVMFDNSLKESVNLEHGNVLNVFTIIEDLFKLPINGRKIKELLEKQKKSRKSEHNNCEYVHQKVKLATTKKAKSNKDKHETTKSKNQKSPSKGNSKVKHEPRTPVHASSQFSDPPPSYKSSYNSRPRTYRQDNDPNYGLVQAEFTNKRGNHSGVPRSFQYENQFSTNQTLIPPNQNQFFYNQRQMPPNHSHFQQNPRHFHPNHGYIQPNSGYFQESNFNPVQGYYGACSNQEIPVPQPLVGQLNSPPPHLPTPGHFNQGLNVQEPFPQGSSCQGHLNPKHFQRRAIHRGGQHGSRGGRKPKSNSQPNVKNDGKSKTKRSSSSSSTSSSD